MKGDEEEHCSIDSYQAMVSDEYCSLTLHIIPPNGISVKKKKKVQIRIQQILLQFPLGKKNYFQL